MYNTKAIGHLFTQYVTQAAHANTGIPCSNTLLFNSSECALIGNVGPKRKHDWFEFQYGDDHDTV